MAHDRSDNAWEIYQQAAQKFDYFMVGLSAALAGYLGQQFDFRGFGANASTGELASIVLFGFSMFAGIQRIEWNVVAIGGNHQRLYHGEAAGALAEVSQKSTAMLNVGTGGIVTPGTALARAQQHRQAAESMQASVDRASARAERAYKWRNRLFYAGVAMLIVARILKAYIP